MSATCLRGPVHCAERRITDGGVVAGDALAMPFCVSDHRAIVAALDDLPWLRLELAVARSQPAAGGDGGTTRVYPEIPIREDVDALEREIDRAVYSWSEAVGDAQGLAPVTRFYHASRRLLRHLTIFYALAPTPISRWIAVQAVPRLPPTTIGTVRASGEAIIVREMSGGDGALELARLHARACALIRRDVPPGAMHS